MEGRGKKNKGSKYPTYSTEKLEPSFMTPKLGSMSQFKRTACFVHRDQNSANPANKPQFLRLLLSSPASHRVVLGRGVRGGCLRTRGSPAGERTARTVRSLCVESRGTDRVIWSCPRQDWTLQSWEHHQRRQPQTNHPLHPGQSAVPHSVAN